MKHPEKCIHSNSITAPCGSCSYAPAKAFAGVTDSIFRCSHDVEESQCYICNPPQRNLLEEVLTELRAIRLLIEQGNKNTGLKRPGVTKFVKNSS